MRDAQLASPEWQAFWTLIDLPVFRGAKREMVMTYVDETQATIDWPALLRDSGHWSHAEQVLLRVAYTLFTGEGTLPIQELNVLDQALGAAVFKSIAERYWPGNER
jgi:hypothetical protein